jgi:hypothetical protein
VTDKVNIPDLQTRLQRRVDMIIETAKKLSELSTPNQTPDKSLLLEEEPTTI